MTYNWLGFLLAWEPPDSIYFLNNIFYYVFSYLFLCTCVHAMVCLWKSEDNLLDSVLSFHVGAGIKLRMSVLGAGTLTC